MCNYVAYNRFYKRRFLHLYEYKFKILACITLVTTKLLQERKSGVQHHPKNLCSTKSLALFIRPP